MSDDIDLERLRTATSALLAYCESNDWAGDDPYDALNSRVPVLPFLGLEVAKDSPDTGSQTQVDLGLDC